MDHHQDSRANSTCNRYDWSSDVNRAFEDAPAINLAEADLWERIHAVVPWRTAEEIKRRYEAICAEFYASESVLVPLPKDAELNNSADHVTLDIKRKESVEKIVKHGNNKGSSRSDGKKGRGKAWSPEEHRLFIKGIQVCGKGEWRRISTNFVVTRTASQVASHAQKFFMRHGFNKDKKRRSIYDAAGMDYQKMLMNPPQRLTDDLRGTEQIGSNSRTDNGGNGLLEVHPFPILKSFDIHSIDYQNAETSLSLKRPRSKHEVGAAAARHGVGLTLHSGMVGGPSDVSSVADQNADDRSSFVRRCEQELDLQEPVHDAVVSSVNEANKSGSGSGSGSASASSSGSSVSLTDGIGAASSYDFFSADFVEVEELASYF